MYIGFMIQLRDICFMRKIGNIYENYQLVKDTEF